MRKISENQRQEKALRQHIYNTLLETCPRDKWGERICARCGKWLHWHWAGFEMHHVIPLSLGGLTSLENCALFCFPCHQDKHNQQR